MSDIYSTLQISPRKRRPSDSEDAITSTPKKLRTAPLTPSSISRRVRTSGTSILSNKLPNHLSRLCAIHSSLQCAISHALATCAVSPTSDSGHLRNVVNHMSLKTYSGLSSSFEIEDLKRLCWLWEWDGEQIPEPKDADKGKEKEKEDNPFLDDPSGVTEDWTRGAMGFLVAATTHLSKQARQRLPAYGVGIEIEMDIDKGMGSGMAAVARWTSATDARQKQLENKLEKWVKLHKGQTTIPAIPLADLPNLPTPIKTSSLTMKLASASPKGANSKPLLFPPTSSVHSPVKKVARDFLVPFPISSPSASPTKKSSIFFPQTPRHKRGGASASTPITPQTPSNKISTDLSDAEGPPETPSKQTGAHAKTAPATPSTSRRQALYERIRQRSITTSPTKNTEDSDTPKLTRDQLLKLSQEEMRRRCLLGRLGGVAESVWMLFATPASGSATPGRKRRALPMAEVAFAVVKSSPVPISTAEANESLTLLVKLCPFFLKKLDIQGEEWLEMPASSSASSGPSGTSSVNATPTKRGLAPPPSPGSKLDSAELIHRSPKRVKEAGGLRDVREIIRRELELQD
ncbi:hypothetical protein P691DRAFT_723592 [Macrolepiota fuliginosa MF-IS2]|uniref:DNA replication factor Cdt1 C-terminal domain-containing protein n=1 Tax=Macrolepiota fuliginosa MF-IS2 TaxID=1400762 RepID=A0A9P6C7Y6_9AGAR|nr:hypothetical protein P691DRAFT_723592 [Macrolepiota fuliginosa MF-IS2]